MLRASHCVGLTFAGIIDEPGSLLGMRISPMPQRGPLASQRMSLAILSNAPASVRTCADRLAKLSCADSATNLFGALTNGSPVICTRCCAHSVPNSVGAFKPVPTAVPPIAKGYKLCALVRKASDAPSNCATHAENSCPNVSGAASCKCVRPVLTMCMNCSD